MTNFEPENTVPKTRFMVQIEFADGRNDVVTYVDTFKEVQTIERIAEQIAIGEVFVTSLEVPDNRVSSESV